MLPLARRSRHRDPTGPPAPGPGLDRARSAPTALGLALAGLLLAPMAPAPSPCAAQNLRTPVHDGWAFREAGGDDWLPASIPGTVHTDLLSDGRIPDPFRGAVEPELQWIGERSWEYRTRLTVPDAPAAGPGEGPTHDAGTWHTELIFEGLDTYADVWLDGQRILRADNMFRAWRVPLQGARPGAVHDVRVAFRPPVAIEDSLADAYPHPLPAGNDAHGTRVFTRKAAYHYGWDWGPRYVTAGIWRPVTLHRWRGATIRDAWVSQDTLTDARAALTARLEVESDGVRGATIVVRSPEGRFEPRTVVRGLADGLNAVVVPFEIAEPRRWWPNGLGEAHLYNVVVEVRLGGEVVDTSGERVGLRTVRLVQEADTIGRSFYFEVNGAPLFMKGANTIPLDHFSPRADSADYRRMFEDVVAANMNMLRVWGGGIYERELFYDLADEHGILIWQDFMFANAMYPGTSEFLENVRAEAEHQVRRLRGHPSVALWCGNNEIREGWENWGWQRQLGYSPADSAAVWRTYERIFHEILPGAVAELDPSRPYWPSSPSIGWGHPESLRYGNSHYWGVWWGEEPFEVLTEKLPRFMSEFGFQAYPPLESIRQFTEPGDRRVGSPVMEAHQKHPRGDELIGTYMARDYPEPRSFADFVYLSQLVQADGIGTALEAHRRAIPRTMGTLYWQLGDTWPVVSWSGIDYFGRWKALHYEARRAFAPVLVSAVLSDDTVRVHLVSDRRWPAAGTLTVRTVGFDGGETFRTERAVELPVNGAAVAVELPVAAVLGGGPGADPAASDHDRSLAQSETEGPRADRRSVLVAELVLDDGARVRDLLYFVEPKALALPDPELETRVRREGGGWVVDVSAGALARAVHLTADGAHFPDNWFDLLPGETRTVPMEMEAAQEARVAGAAPVVRARSLAENGPET